MSRSLRHLQLMPRIATRQRGRPLLIFQGKSKFLAFLAAFEVLVLIKKKFFPDSEKLLFLPKYSFGSDTARLKWLPGGQANYNFFLSVIY